MNRIRFSVFFDFSLVRTGWKIYPVYRGRERENGRSFRFATPNLSSPRKLGKASYVTLFASYHPFLVIPLFDPCSWNYIRIRYITGKLERKRGGKVSRESIYCNTSMGEIVNGGMKEGWVKRWMGMELNICS